MVRKLVLSLIAILGIVALAVAQNKQVSGTVTGHDGMPVAGATVMVEGTNIGTTTGADGKFSLSAPADGALAVSFIGYQTQQLSIAGKTKVDVTLAEDTQKIDDVIVVAFGTSKKEAFTGSAAVLRSDDISKTQSSNVSQSLAGKMAGVQVVSSSGQPGKGAVLHIRGISSISAETEPLYVLDGIPLPESKKGANGLENINPADIESITVLKDATSNALYGARGANGVVMITTKRGKRGDAVINIDAKWGVNSRALKQYDYISDPAQYYETHYGALYNYAYLNQQKSASASHLWANDNLINGSYGLGYQVYTVPEGQYFIGQSGKVNPNATLGRKVSHNGQDYYLTPDNWNDEAFRTSLRQEYNFSVSGGTERSSFYASLGYLDDQGIAYNSDFTRYSGRLRADFQAKKWLKVGGTAGYSHYTQNSLNDEGLAGSSGNLFTFTSRVGPIYPVYIRDGNGQIMQDARGYKRYDYGMRDNAGLPRPVMSSANPMSSNMLDTDRSTGNALNMSGFAEFKLVEGLSVTINAGMSLDETRSNQVTNGYYGQYASSKGIASVGHSRLFGYNLQQLINYSKTFAEKHTMSLLAGHEYYNYKTLSLDGSKSNMFSPDNIELDGAVTAGAAYSAMTDYNTEGYFFRGEYNYDSRFYVSGSYRRDASSRFHPDHRWGNFWSIGGAWLINNESWFNASWVDLLKAKVSYGSQGNDRIGAYRYADLYQITPSDGNVSVVFYSKGNPNITWETNESLNAGVDFSLFGGRLGGSLDYFHRKTTDMLFARPVPVSLGYTSYIDNIGDMVNKGIEIELHATPLKYKNFSWDVNFNMTHLKNRVTQLPPEKNGGFQNGNYWIGEGDALNTFYMYKYAGVDPQGQSMWYKDDGQGGRTTTTAYSEASYYKCGAADPDLYGGFGTTFSFYGFDVGANFTYQIGGLAYDSGYAQSMSSPLSGDTGSNVHKDILKAWSPTNTASNIPRYMLADQYSARMSDRFLTDASYFNIQNVNVGYTLPRKLTRKFYVDRIRIYLACENVWYASRRQGFDPRQSYDGTTSSELYSPVRTISGGINIQF